MYGIIIINNLKFFKKIIDIYRFDEGKFDDFESAIEFAKGRGGTYNVQIEGPKNVMSLSCDGESFSYYNGCEWVDISEKEIKKIIG